MKRVYIIIVLLVLNSCIDPIDLEVPAEDPRLVVEGLISNISLNDRADLQADPHPFYVRLGLTSPVGNERDPVITDAGVFLHSASGGVWNYAWNDDYQMYLMLDPDFAALPGEEYFLEVQLSSGKRYISSNETLMESQEIGDVSYEFETRIQEAATVSGTVLREQQGVKLSVHVPERNESSPVYYRWNLLPSWIFEAELLSDDNPNKTCYVTNRYYFDKINVGTDNGRGLTKEIFFLETQGNNRLEHQFTVNITQYSLTREGYEFWEELALQQASGGGIFDPPPFELSTNISNVDDADELVSGFFMVAHESSKRIYIDPSDIPYDLELTSPCVVPPGMPNIPPPPCFDCRGYRGGSSAITNQKPSWWITE